MPVGTRMRNAWKIPEDALQFLINNGCMAEEQQLFEEVLSEWENRTEAEQEEPCVGRRVELLRLDLSYFKKAMYTDNAYKMTGALEDWERLRKNLEMVKPQLKRALRLIRQLNSTSAKSAEEKPNASATKKDVTVIDEFFRLHIGLQIFLGLGAILVGLVTVTCILCLMRFIKLKMWPVMMNTLLWCLRPIGRVVQGWEQVNTTSAPPPAPANPVPRVAMNAVYQQAPEERSWSFELVRRPGGQVVIRPRH